MMTIGLALAVATMFSSIVAAYYLGTWVAARTWQLTARQLRYKQLSPSMREFMTVEESRRYYDGWHAALDFFDAHYHTRRKAIITPVYDQDETDSGMPNDVRVVEPGLITPEIQEKTPFMGDSGREQGVPQERPQNRVPLRIEDPGRSQ